MSPPSRNYPERRRRALFRVGFCSDKDLEIVPEIIRKGSDFVPEITRSWILFQIIREDSDFVQRYVLCCFTWIWHMHPNTHTNTSFAKNSVTHMYVTCRKSKTHWTHIVYNFRCLCDVHHFYTNIIANYLNIVLWWLLGACVKLLNPTPRADSVHLCLVCPTANATLTCLNEIHRIAVAISAQITLGCGRTSPIRSSRPRHHPRVSLTPSLRDAAVNLASRWRPRSSSQTCRRWGASLARSARARTWAMRLQARASRWGPRPQHYT